MTNAPLRIQSTQLSDFPVAIQASTAYSDNLLASADIGVADGALCVYVYL